jgi:hypothetical protein
MRGEDCQIIRMFIYLESHKCKASCDVSIGKEENMEKLEELKELKEDYSLIDEVGW